jgi:hypothetical protein
MNLGKLSYTEGVPRKTDEFPSLTISFYELHNKVLDGNLLLK